MRYFLMAVSLFFVLSIVIWAFTGHYIWVDAEPTSGRALVLFILHMLGTIAYPAYCIYPRDDA